MTIHKPKTVYSFTGDFRFLSNFHPCFIKYDQLSFPSVEHAYQAAKTSEESDRIQIAQAPTPGHAKKMGKLVRLRPDWEEVKLSIMEFLVSQKFSDPVLETLLLKTGDMELVEGNTRGDYFWGRCRGQGRNELGKILMKVREEIRERGGC